MTLSEAKLRNLIGEFRLAAPEEIIKAGAAPGFASPVGLENALVIVDDLIPSSPNLVAGANEAEYHSLNVNCGRDYTPDEVADLTLAKQNDDCIKCGEGLSEISALALASHSEFRFENILLVLAETFHDDKGLTLPKSIAPFDIYLMQVPGKEMDTLAKAEEIYKTLQHAGIPVLFDDREERAGVKFNDADLIGCPLRVTVGEKNLKEGMVELKPRKAKENRLVKLENLIEEIGNS
jgi:prolyl-tRNA synthetase